MNITSLNVNGLAQEKKRKAVFNKCKNFKSIIFLQEPILALKTKTNGKKNGLET